MKKLLPLVVAGLLLAGFAIVPAAAQTAPTVYFGIAVHSEEPGGTPPANTPDFRSTQLTNYLAWRDAILWFAEECRTRTLPWNCQFEWNMLEGVRRFEVPGGSNYTFTASTNTGGTNLMLHLHRHYGVELDPHSHESQGYNYADVAYLLSVLGVTPSGVVGGHVYDPTAGEMFQNWPRFVADADGLNSVKYPGYAWRPRLLMGAGSPSHTKDPNASGLWRPAGTNTFFTDLPTGPIAAIGNWSNDLHEHNRLLALLESGQLAHSNKLWTAYKVFNHRDMLTESNRAVIRAQLDTIRRWRDAGRFTVANFETIHAVWTNAPFAAQASVFERPADNVSFSLNWQDFAYPSNSIAELRMLLNQHEASGVPVDVFFTTWQTDLIESLAPDLLGRLQSSAWVNMGYHVRAPKPYANNFAWAASTSNSIAQYESSGLNLTNGQPTASSGGYAKLTALMGYAPTVVGANADVSVSSLVHSYFAAAGAGLLVEHRATAINLGDVRNGLDLRPEHYDWKLIENYRGTNPVTSLDLAFAQARASSGATAPFFTGVKLHDNDLFSEQSAWTYVYQSPSRHPSQYAVPPWDPSAAPAALSSSERDARRAFYTNLVATAATRRATVNLVEARDIVGLLGNAGPRPVGLTRTEISEASAPGTEIARLRGGGVASGVAVDYALVSGDGATDNARFAVTGDRLLLAAPLDYETAPTLRVRVRWTDGGGFTGERALTLTLANSTDDDDDGDTLTEAQEAIAGTDPRNAASVFRTTLTSAAAGQVTLSFPSAAGRTYVVERSADLRSWVTVGSPVVAGGSSLAVNITPSLATGEFYRLRVSQ